MRFTSEQNCWNELIAETLPYISTLMSCTGIDVMHDKWKSKMWVTFRHIKDRCLSQLSLLEDSASRWSRSLGSTRVHGKDAADTRSWQTSRGLECRLSPSPKVKTCEATRPWLKLRLLVKNNLELLGRCNVNGCYREWALAWRMRKQIANPDEPDAKHDNDMLKSQ